MVLILIHMVDDLLWFDVWPLFLPPEKCTFHHFDSCLACTCVRFVMSLLSQLVHSEEQWFSFCHLISDHAYSILIDYDRILVESNSW